MLLKSILKSILKCALDKLKWLCIAESSGDGRAAVERHEERIRCSSTHPFRNAPWWPIEHWNVVYSTRQACTRGRGKHLQAPSLAERAGRLLAVAKSTENMRAQHHHDFSWPTLLLVKSRIRNSLCALSTPHARGTPLASAAHAKHSCCHQPASLARKTQKSAAMTRVRSEKAQLQTTPRLDISRRSAVRRTLQTTFICRRLFIRTAGSSVP